MRRTCGVRRPLTKGAQHDRRRHHRYRPADAAGARARAGEILAVDGWTREQLLELQRERLHEVVEHAVMRSPYYREALGLDAPEADLSDLPTLPKTLLMEQFDRVVTDPHLRASDLLAFVADAGPGRRTATPRLRHFRRDRDTGALRVLPRRVRALGRRRSRTPRPARCHIRDPQVAIGAPGDVHHAPALRVVPGGPAGVPRLSVVTPVAEAVEALNAYQPEVAIAYASVLGTLAEEQLQGRLAIAPRVTLSTSEVLTDEIARRVEQAWGAEPLNVYAATEAPGIAMASLDQVGMHLCEESVVLEVVDASGKPVPPGCRQPGAAREPRKPRAAADPLRAHRCRGGRGRPGPERPAARLARVDGRSDDILVFPARGGGEVEVHPHRLRAPFSTLLEVRQYQIVHERDGGLRVRIVPSPSAAAGLSERVRSATARELEEANGRSVRRRQTVTEIEREPGAAAKLKLVTTAR